MEQDRFYLLEQGRGSDWEGPWRDSSEIYFTYKGKKNQVKKKKAGKIKSMKIQVSCTFLLSSFYGGYKCGECYYI